MSSVTLYTKPRCAACSATKRHLDRLGITYSSVDISTDAAALEYLTEQGFRSAPVVVTPTGAWSGYNPDKIDALASAR